MKIKVNLDSSTPQGGTVQDLVCLRDGNERWRKKVYIPHEELPEFQAKYLLKRHGPFVYDSNGEINVVKRRPRNVPDWKE